MKLDGSRGIERCQALIFDRWSYRGAIERCPQQSHLDGSRSYRVYKNFLDGSRSCREAIETNSQKLRWIEIAITVVEKRRLRGSRDSLAIERYWEAVEIAQKQFFKEEKNTYMNAIKHTKDPNNILSSQKHFSKGKCQAFRLKTHTHTHTHTTSLTNFIFQKQIKIV